MKVLFSIFFFLLSCTALGQSNISSQSAASPIQIDEVRARVNQLIHSDKSQDQAWGAYLIGKYRFDEFTPELIKLLNVSKTTSSDTEHVHRAILDALIQINANVKNEVLLPHYQRFSTQVLILLANDSLQNQEALLSLLGAPQTNEEYLATCNLLVRIKNKSLAFKLLRDLKVEASITVVSSNHFGGFGGGDSSGGCGDGWLNKLAGFPPVAFYSLSHTATRGFVVLALGRHAIYYVRKEARVDESGSMGIGSCFTTIQKNTYRVEYLAELLNTSAQKLGFFHTPSFTIVWKGRLNYKLEALKAREEVQRSYRQLLNRLIEAEMLTKEESGLLVPVISLNIHDIRKDKSISLPEI